MDSLPPVVSRRLAVYRCRSRPFSAGVSVGFRISRTDYASVKLLTLALGRLMGSVSEYIVFLDVR